ncbi:MAG: MerR family transcriptional regulator [Thermoanaerobaculum sp.]
MRASGRDGTFTLPALAKAAGVSPRTVRFYISRGLLPPPLMRGRGARYGQEHLDRLAEIKKLQQQGLTLAEIARRFAGPAPTLPPPVQWLGFPLAEDVVVWVRQPAAPWRMARIKQALESLAALLAE